ncbi:MAG: hypothetical protein WB564_02200 [Dehalococcoidia bacterium]
MLNPKRRNPKAQAPNSFDFAQDRTKQYQSTFCGYIPGFDGVYAKGEDLETYRRELKEVWEEWIVLDMSRHLVLPIVDAIGLVVEEVF